MQLQIVNSQSPKFEILKNNFYLKPSRKNLPNVCSNESQKFSNITFSQNKM